MRRRSAPCWIDCCTTVTFSSVAPEAGEPKPEPAKRVQLIPCRPEWDNDRFPKLPHPEPPQLSQRGRPPRPRPRPKRKAGQKAPGGFRVLDTQGLRSETSPKKSPTTQKQNPLSHKPTFSSCTEGLAMP